MSHGVLRRPELADDPRFRSNAVRVVNRGELNAAIRRVFGAVPDAELIERLSASQVAFGRVNSVAGFVAHPALRRTRVQTPSGPAELPAEAFPWGAEGEPDRVVPELGSHSEAVRMEFGTD